METLVKLIYPMREKCLFCQEERETGEKFLCKSCLDKVEIVNKEIKIDFPYMEKAYYSILYNRFIKEKIKEYKFNGKNYLYKPLGEFMVKTIIEYKIEEKIDVILYIPIHKRKEAIRGYNQSELLGKYISNYLKKEMSKNNLIKFRWTKEQNTLTRLERLSNLNNSFKIKDLDWIKGKNILLVDDIITTGATMKECSKILKEAGAKEIIGIGLTSSKG